MQFHKLACWTHVQSISTQPQLRIGYMCRNHLLSLVLEELIM